MAAVKLNTRVITELEPKEKTYAVFDTEIRGFGVRVWPSGVKVFVFKYERQAKQHWLTLGRFGELTFEQAKKRALKHRLEITDGQNPGAVIRAKREAPSVADLADRFLRDHADLKTKPRTAAEYRRMVELFIKPKLGRLKVADVLPADAYEFHTSLAKTPRQANHTLAVLSKMFSLAELWGWRTQNTNPCFIVERLPERRRDRFLTEKELERLGQVIQEMEDAITDSIYVFAALRMLIFTGARLSEILTLTWAMVDLENGMLRLPDSKTGAKVIFLNPPAIRLLKVLPEIQDNPYVFPGDRENDRLVNLEKPWRKIRDKAGLPNVRIHDLRHTFASMAAQSGLSLQVVGALLGHTHPSTTKRYSHFGTQPLLDSSKQVGAKLAKALEQPVKKPSKKQGS